MRTHCLIRVRWERAGQFKAVSMDLRDRKEASSTSSAESAVLACAAKVLNCGAGEIAITPPRRPLKQIDEVVTVTSTGDWHAFECVVKGSLTQMDLLPGGVS
jgi:hypothetical protein